MSSTVDSHANAKRKGTIPKRLSPWVKHWTAYAADHPRMSKKAAMKAARKSYVSKAKAKPARKAGGARKRVARKDKAPCKTGGTRSLKGGKKRGLTSYQRFQKIAAKEGRVFKTATGKRRAYLAWMRATGCEAPKKKAGAKKAGAKKGARKGAKKSQKNEITSMDDPMSFDQFEQLWHSQLAQPNARRPVAAAQLMTPTEFDASYSAQLRNHANAKRRATAAARVAAAQEDEQFLIDDEVVAQENRRRRKGGKRAPRRRLAGDEEADGEMELLTADQ